MLAFFYREYIIFLKTVPGATPGADTAASPDGVFMDFFEIEPGDPIEEMRSCRRWRRHYGTDKFLLLYPQKTLFDALSDSEQKDPSACAIDFEGTRISYKKLKKMAVAAGSGFYALGIRPGDAVTLSLPNIPQALYCFYGLSMIGAVPAMIHPLSSENEILQYMRLSRSKAVVTADMFFGKNYRAASDYREETGKKIVTVVTSIGDGLSRVKGPAYELVNKSRISEKTLPADALSWKKFIANGIGAAKKASKTADRAEGSAKNFSEIFAERIEYNYRTGKKQDDTAVILFSGGTTGEPKGIMLTDLNLNALAIETRTAGVETIKPDFKMLSVMPLFHGFGLGIGIHMPIYYGVRCVLMPRFSIEGYAKILRKKKPNFIPGVPTLFEALLRSKQLEKADLSFLVGVYSGGDTLLPELKDRVDDFLRKHNASVEIREGYGTTECVTASCLTPRMGGKRGSIGIPYPDHYYDIVKPGTTESLPPNTEGEIVLRGPLVMKGYIDNEKETAEALRLHKDGRIWLHTGDLGTIDEDGFVYFKQRLKRLIVTSGYNVYPSAVENVVCTHPDVDSCCVIGIKDDYKMEKVKAFVVLKSGVTPSEALKNEIREFCKKRMMKISVPSVIEFRESLPKTPVGKVDYRALEKEEEQKKGQPE